MPNITALNNDGTQPVTSSNIKLRANSGGNPLSHNDVDSNFENLRAKLDEVRQDTNDLTGGQYNLSGPQGAQGATGSAGSTGAQGAQGRQGTAGSNGSNGAQGAQGRQGIQGRQGTSGSTGAQGTTGSQGTQGRQGTTGSTGAQGTAGSDASTLDGSDVVIKGSTGNFTWDDTNLFTPIGITNPYTLDPHVKIEGGARTLSNGAANVPLLMLNGDGPNAEAAMFIHNNSTTTGQKGAVIVMSAEKSLTTAGQASQWCNIGLQSQVGKMTIGHVLANPGGNTVGIEMIAVNGSEAFVPTSNGVLNLGASTTRWKQLFATTTTISTSDQNLKQDIASLSEAEKRVAVAVKGLIKKFRFRDAVEQKGASARTHFGVIAQELEQAFIAEGLDGFDYGVLCKDTTWEGRTPATANYPNGTSHVVTSEPTAEDLALVDENGFTKSTTYSVRYEELYAFIISAL